MTKRDKLRKRLRNSPKNVSYQEIDTLLTRFGFVLSRTTGSHHIHIYGEGESARNIIIPADHCDN